MVSFQLETRETYMYQSPNRLNKLETPAPDSREGSSKNLKFEDSPILINSQNDYAGVLSKA